MSPKGSPYMEVPSSLYYLLGSLVVANIGTIGSVLVFGAKSIWWLSKLESKVTENTEDVNNAFVKIRDLEKKVYRLDA